MCMGSLPSGPSMKKQQDYMAQDDFGTLQRADEVQADSARHARALAHGRKQIAGITRVMKRGFSGKSGRMPKRTVPGRA